MIKKTLEACKSITDAASLATPRMYLKGVVETVTKMIMNLKSRKDDYYRWPHTNPGRLGNRTPIELNRPGLHFFTPTLFKEYT
jgi:hypothetical protein